MEDAVEELDEVEKKEHEAKTPKTSTDLIVYNRNNLG
jgi:hypothetical protein